MTILEQIRFYQSKIARKPDTEVKRLANNALVLARITADSDAALEHLEKARQHIEKIVPILRVAA